MNDFLKYNKRLLTYSLILFVITSIFGVNFLVSILGNILLLLFLIPLLLILLVFIGFNTYKSKIKTCNNCGEISLGLSDTCMNCGAIIDDLNKKNKTDKNPSDVTIDVKVEEIK